MIRSNPARRRPHSPRPRFARRRAGLQPGAGALGDPRDPLTGLVHHAGGVVSELTRTGQGQHVLHDACSLSCADYGSNWSASTGNGFYGGLQFTEQTWLGYGGSRYAPSASQATPAQQITVARQVLTSQASAPGPCAEQTANTALASPARTMSTSTGQAGDARQIAQGARFAPIKTPAATLMTKLSRQPQLARALVPQRLSSSGTRYHQICATTAISALSAPTVQTDTCAGAVCLMTFCDRPVSLAAMDRSRRFRFPEVLGVARG